MRGSWWSCGGLVGGGRRGLLLCAGSVDCRRAGAVGVLIVVSAAEPVRLLARARGCGLAH